VTVVVPTRDRGARIVTTLRTLLWSDYRQKFDVCVVDQSEDDATEIAVKQWSDEATVRYTRTATRGLSAALNVGIERSPSELIAITGDDCEVGVEWLSMLTAMFSVHRQIAIVFGNVMSGGHDPALGFVPGYVRMEP